MCNIEGILNCFQGNFTHRGSHNNPGKIILLLDLLAWDVIFGRRLMYEGLEENISPKSDALGRKLHLGSGRICSAGQRNEALGIYLPIYKAWIQYYIPV